MTMQNFENSFKFFFGVADFSEGWDSLNNPYLEFKGHQMRTGQKFQNVHELHHCPTEELSVIMPRADMMDWYPSAICFKNPENVFVDRNWFFRGYSFPSITISYCKNTTENNSWCKSKDEID